MPSETLYVLDSWPVLEWLIGNQPAAKKFSEFLRETSNADATLLISRMNYGEVIYMLPKKLSHVRLEQARTALMHIPFEIVTVDDHAVDEAVAIKSENACSFADCFAVTIAMNMHAPVVTGDREFLQLQSKGLIQLHWLGA